jgi:hypothetical protein
MSGSFREFPVGVKNQAGLVLAYAALPGGACLGAECAALWPCLFDTGGLYLYNRRILVFPQPPVDWVCCEIQSGEDACQAAVFIASRACRVTLELISLSC